MKRPMTLEVAVALGAALLDKAAPDWFQRINFEQLCESGDVGSSILIQLFGSHREGEDVLRPRFDRSDGGDLLRLADYGFVAYFFDDDEIPGVLLEHWAGAIAQRRTMSTLEHEQVTASCAVPA